MEIHLLPNKTDLFFKTSIQSKVLFLHQTMTQERLQHKGLKPSIRRENDKPPFHSSRTPLGPAEQSWRRALRRKSPSRHPWGRCTRLHGTWSCNYQDIKLSCRQVRGWWWEGGCLVYNNIHSLSLKTHTSKRNKRRSIRKGLKMLYLTIAMQRYLMETY